MQILVGATFTFLGQSQIYVNEESSGVCQRIIVNSKDNFPTELQAIFDY